MGLLIRELNEEDSLQITELYKSFGLLMDTFENGNQGYTGGYYRDDSYKEDIYYSDEENPSYVAEIDGRIIGFIEAFFENNYIELNDYVCIISNIYVIDEYRKYNIGKLLVDKIISIALLKNTDYISASVLPRNISAAKFFNNLGFKANGQIFIKDVNKLLSNGKHK